MSTQKVNTKIRYDIYNSGNLFPKKTSIRLSSFRKSFGLRFSTQSGLNLTCEMCVTTTGHCRHCSRSNTRRIECKEKCGVWQEDSWGENSICQKCSDDTAWLSAGPELTKGDIRRILNGSSLVDKSLMSKATPPFDPQKWAQPITTDTKQKSPDLSGYPSSSRQWELMAPSHLPFETSSHFSGYSPNRAASTSKEPPSPTDTQPKVSSTVPDLSLRKKPTPKTKSAIKFPHASPSLSGNPSSSRQLESRASSSSLRSETPSLLPRPSPNRAAATSKHPSKFGGSSNPSQKPLSSGPSMLKPHPANPSKSKSSQLAKSRAWPQDPGASWSKQRLARPATTANKEPKPNDSQSPEKPSSCFPPAGR